MYSVYEGMYYGLTKKAGVASEVAGEAPGWFRQTLDALKNVWRGEAPEAVAKDVAERSGAGLTKGLVPPEEGARQLVKVPDLAEGTDLLRGTNLTKGGPSVGRELGTIKGRVATKGRPWPELEGEGIVNVPSGGIMSVTYTPSEKALLSGSGASIRGNDFSALAKEAPVGSRLSNMRRAYRNLSPEMQKRLRSLAIGTGVGVAGLGTGLALM